MSRQFSPVSPQLQVKLRVPLRLLAPTTVVNRSRGIIAGSTGELSANQTVSIKKLSSKAYLDLPFSVIEEKVARLDASTRTFAHTSNNPMIAHTHHDRYLIIDMCRRRCR